MPGLSDWSRSSNLVAAKSKDGKVGQSRPAHGYHRPALEQSPQLPRCRANAAMPTRKSPMSECSLLRLRPAPDNGKEPQSWGDVVTAV
jgi:hypothetical protein